ncbi:NDP-hexose 2,3-dehydratase family protein [Actinosynnema sp. NPDC049800]
MSETTAAQAVLLRTTDATTPVRIAESVFADSGSEMSLPEFLQWFAERLATDGSVIDKIPLRDLKGWRTDPDTGNLVHDSGKFFVVEGLSVRIEGAAVPAWTQPIINQPEIGILGILVKEFNGVLHCLMQAKMEPGNCNTLQLSPTVQATKSNYTRVHKGAPVPYLDYFTDTGPNQVLADVLQSEQGSWYYRKRNRNIIVETTDDVELLDGFCWLTIGQLHHLFEIDNLVNMDSRTVLSCLPFSGDRLTEAFSAAGGAVRLDVLRSCSDDEGSLHTIGEILSWITGARTRHDVATTRIPLDQVEHWVRTDERISHESGLFFNVVGVDTVAGNREVRSWTQPMIEPTDVGVVAFLAKPINGVLHVLVNARVEPGYLDVVELGPTVQGMPSNYSALPAAARPPFLDEVLAAPPDRVRFETVLSEEGGRFFNAQTRYTVVEVDLEVPPELAEDYRWMTLHQLVSLLRHGHYVNVQARSLIACLHSTFGASNWDEG